MDKKQATAAKFKSPKIVKSLLERYDVDTSKITDKAEFLSGTVGLTEGNYEMVIAVKKNGAGKSTLRTVMNTREEILQAMVDYQNGKMGSL